MYYFNIVVADRMKWSKLVLIGMILIVLDLCLVFLQITKDESIVMGMLILGFLFLIYGIIFDVIKEQKND